MTDDPKELVRRGYDQIADCYLATKEPLNPELTALLARLLAGSPADAPVLDLGCGAGVPITAWLAQRRPVTGVDLPARQLELARRHVPNATLIQADMAQVDFPPATFGAVVAAYSTIHVPRDEQPPLLRRLHGWLRPGGGFLATWPSTTWEGQEADWQGWGAPMWWSHFDRATSLAMLRDAGFVVEVERVIVGAETWLWVLARHGHGFR